MTELLVGTKKGLSSCRGSRGRRAVRHHSRRGRSPATSWSSPCAIRGAAATSRVGHVRFLRAARDVHGRPHGRVDPGCLGPRSPRGVGDLGGPRVGRLPGGRWRAVRRGRARVVAAREPRQRRDVWSLERSPLEVNGWPEIGCRARAAQRCIPSRPWPGDHPAPAIGVSAAGVWLTEDGWKSWRTGYTGLHPQYVPEDVAETTNALRACNNMHRAPSGPSVSSCSSTEAYRSDDEGSTCGRGGTAVGLRVFVGGGPGRSRQRARGSRWWRMSTGSDARGPRPRPARAMPGRRGRRSTAGLGARGHPHRLPPGAFAHEGEGEARPVPGRPAATFGSPTVACRGSACTSGWHL